MKRRLFKSLRIALLLTLSALTIAILILRHRSPTMSDRFYRARNGRFVQLDSRDHRMRLIFIHDYPNDEPLSWKTDKLTDYLPGRVPVILAPVPLLRLTPMNEESAGPLAASKGLADKKPYPGFGGGYVISTNKPPSNQYPTFSLRTPPATKPAEKPPSAPTLDGFHLGKTVPQRAEPPVYYAGSATAMITRPGTPITIPSLEPETTVVMANASSNRTLTATGANAPPAPPPAWPYRAYSLPHWIVALVVGLYPLIVLTRFVRRQILRWRRRKTVQCLNCGYDIRATPDRCPECGTVTGDSTAPAPA
jgi:hypothetical protein